MVRLARRLIAADADARNAWLLVVVLLASLVCVMETLGDLMLDGPSAAVLAVRFVFAAAVALMAFRPVVGCVPVVAVSLIACLTRTPLPSGALPAVLIAVGVGGYAGRRLCVALAGVVSAVWLLATPGFGSPGDAGSTGTGWTVLGSVTIEDTTSMIALVVAAALCGVAVRWNRERALERAELDARRRRERAARTIHDYVSNDLAYLVLRLDKDLTDGLVPSADELRELRDTAAEALERTRRVIDVIEGRTEQDGATGRQDAKAPAGDGVGIGPGRALDERLRSIACEGDDRLSRLGFRGRTILTCSDVGDSGNGGIVGHGGTIGTDGDAAAIAADLLRELYGNIAKHADPDHDYVMTVGIGADAVRLVCVDAPRADAPGVDATGTSNVGDSGTGLARYRHVLKSRGGTLRVDADGGEWVLSAVVPYRGDV